MKKIVIIVTVTIIATVATHAQVPNVEVRIANAGFKGLKLSTPKASSSDTLQNAVQRQLAKANAQAVQNKKEGTATQTPSAENTSAPTKDSQQVAASGNNSSGVMAWIKAIVLGGRLPGESAESYRRRLEMQSLPAGQPYK